MTIDIEIKGADAINEIYDLRNFIHEQEISDIQLQLKEQPAIDGTMSIVAVAGLVATIAGEMALKASIESVLEKPVHSLTESIKQWLIKRKKEGKADIEVYTEEKDNHTVKSFVTDCNGLTTPLNKLNFSIDVKNTRVLLIGNSEFDFNFPPIKPVKGNVEDFYQMLTDKKIVGIPPENITLVFNKTSSEIEEQLLLLSSEPGIETLLIYYAGHGYKADAKKLYLVAKNSKKINDHIIGAVDFDFIKNVILKQSGASQKIVILDACHSGIATQGEADYLAGFDVKGTYIFTSSSGDEVSYFNAVNQHTFFTGEMINVFKNGLENNYEKIALKDVYDAVAHSLKEKNFPEPRYKNDLNIPLSHFYIAHNCKFSVDKWKLKARQLLKEGKTDDALREYNQLLQQYPNDEALRIEIGEAEKENRYLFLVNKADAFFQDQEFEKAIENYDEALQLKQEFSVLSRKNKCQEYLEVKRKLLAKNNPIVTTDLTLTKEKPAVVIDKPKPPVIKREEQKPDPLLLDDVIPTKEKEWYLAVLFHVVLFGFGVFYLNQKAKRRWLYPACIFLSLFIVLLATSGVKIINNDGFYIFRRLFFTGIFIGIFGGLFECLVLLNSNATQKKPMPVLTDISIINKAKRIISIISGLWVIEYLFTLYVDYQIRGQLFNFNGFMQVFQLITQNYIFLFLPPVMLLLLVKKNNKVWTLATVLSILQLSLLLAEIAAAFYKNYYIQLSWLPIIESLIVHACVLYLLNNTVILAWFRISKKTVNTVSIVAVMTGCLFGAISFLIGTGRL